MGWMEKMNSSQILKVGTKNIYGVAVTISDDGDGSLRIERIEVPEAERRKGLSAKIALTLAAAAKQNGIGLNASICPDDMEATRGLREAFNRAGFTPLELNGEVYRNEIEFNL